MSREGIRGWTYSFTHSYPWPYIEVSHQCHFQVTLTPGKVLLVPNEQKAGWASQLFWKIWRKEKSLSSAGK